MAKEVKNAGGAKGGMFAHGGPSGKVGSTSGPARSVGPQKPGVSSQQGSGSGKFATGGNSSMKGFSGAGKAKAGDTANPMNGNKGMWAQGGPSGQCAPNRGSQAAQPGKSSAY